uniref:Fucolectin tachylectin-4 pentraxin-1 domain-containing protein n=1 Tax=Monopterus albus TaxID=43700 RepID=A0A3Q3IL79_MONAL
VGRTTLLLLLLLFKQHAYALHCDSILTLTGKETFQTSDYSDHTRNYSSDRAIDGNTKSCSHTCSESKANDWWRIDLLGLYEISCISLYNTDQKNIKMSSAEIYIGNSSEKTGTANKRCTTLHGFNPGTNKTFICDGKPILGRYVTVYQHNSDFVVLCEVQIYGTKKGTTDCNRNSCFILAYSKTEFLALTSCNILILNVFFLLYTLGLVCLPI